jgi:cytochrome c oxidase assembly protein subunit 15
MPAAPNQGVHRFAIFTACCTVLLLTAGALVTSNDAGLAVPDWPLSYGSLMPPMFGGIFYEHGHRMIATLVGTLTIVLAVWLSLVEPRRWVRRLGWTALGLVIAQGLLGGLTVLLYLPPAVSSAHATLAQLYFITVLSLAVFTSPRWLSDLEVREDAGSPALRTLAVATTVSIVVQLILGAAFRHNLFGIVPHLVGAGVAAVMVIWTGLAIKKRFRDFRPLRRAMSLLHATFGTQILLGGVTYWVVFYASRNDPQPLPLFISVTVAHVVVGALTLAASMLVTLACYRILRPSRAMEVSRSPERAPI